MKFIHLHHNYIKPDWKILHVGGGQQPFRRANFIIDNTLYKERQTANSWMQTIPEYFSESTWVEQPIEQFPWPFEEEEFDLVIVDSALVMSRDPIGICFEMERVGKRGYIEIPSETTEHLRGLTDPNLTGFQSHRWIATLENNRLKFVYKNPLIHTKSDFWIEPPTDTAAPYIDPKFGIQAIFWDTVLEVYEDKEASLFPDWFYEENVWKHKDLIGTVTSEKDFWQPNMPVAVLLEQEPFKEGKLVTLQELAPQFSIPLFSAEGNRNVEMLKFEQLIAMKIRKEKHG